MCAEAFARFFGTPTFLGAQTLIVVLWVCLNLFGVAHFDLYPFILLNLAFSLQSALGQGNRSARPNSSNNVTTERKARQSGRVSNQSAVS